MPLWHPGSLWVVGRSAERLPATPTVRVWCTHHSTVAISLLSSRWFRNPSPLQPTRYRHLSALHSAQWSNSAVSFFVDKREPLWMGKTNQREGSGTVGTGRFSEAIEKFLINSPVFSSSNVGNRHRLGVPSLRPTAIITFLRHPPSTAAGCRITLSKS